MTSSDLGDTALSYQITQALDIILEDVKQLGETCKRRAFEFQDALCVGRTHGIHAEPMTFGMKFGSWAWALKRAQTRLQQAREVAATGAISGAVGTYSSIDPFVEQYVCEKTGPRRPTRCPPRCWRATATPRSWPALAVTASTLESPSRMQVRLHAAVRRHRGGGAVHEGPEGLSRPCPTSATPSRPSACAAWPAWSRPTRRWRFDDVALWYERDISHSGAERVALADSFIALDYMFGKMQWMLDGLQTYPDKMVHNLMAHARPDLQLQGAAGARGHGHQRARTPTSSCSATP